MESKVSTEQPRASFNDDAEPESATDVMTVCDRSNLTHQERQEFWKNVEYSPHSNKTL
jgi:hypothetical protein